METIEKTLNSKQIRFLDAALAANEKILSLQCHAEVLTAQINDAAKEVGEIINILKDAYPLETDT
jgi:hypothetical protein